MPAAPERLHALARRWREEAELLRRYGDDRGAAVAELLASELMEAIRAAGEQPLTLHEAAAESGYSVRRLRELVAAGEIPQAGRRGAPRVRRADLPRRARRQAEGGGYDPASDARSLAVRLAPKG